MAINDEEYGPRALRKSVCSCCKFGVHAGPDIPGMIRKENESRLRDYPVGDIDPFIHQIATKETFGTASCTTVGTLDLQSGRKLVYLLRHQEGDSTVETSRGPQRVFEYSVGICGYETTVEKMASFLRIPLFYRTSTKKVEVIPQEERDQVVAELSSKVTGAKAISFEY